MSLTKVSYSMILGASANILDFGAIGDGVTNDTVAVQAAINSGAANIIYPKGNYLVGQLTLVSNQNHVGEGGTLVSSNPSANMMSGISVSNLSFKGLNFNSTGVAVSCIAVQGTLTPASNCSNILVDGCSCIGGIQLFSTYQPSGSVYSTITNQMLSTNIRIVNNSVFGTTATLSGGGLGAIALYYATDCAVANNMIVSQVHGIFLWGGDGSGTDWAITNERKCYRITVTGNVIRNIQGGGIVGNMCKEVAATGNVVEYCTDVGIDWESCFDCVASGNYLLDCINGALVTYNVVHGILFSGNKCSSSVANRNITMHNNTVGAPLAQVRDVSYIGNTFECTASLTGSMGVCYVSDTEVSGTPVNPVQNIVCSSNTFINCAVRHKGDNLRQASYIGNTFFYAFATGAAFNALESYNAQGGVTISGNTFNILATCPATTNAIYVSSYSFGLSVVNVIQNNSMMAASGAAWGCAIQCIDGGGSSPTYYTLSNNTFAANIKVNASGNTYVKAINNTDYGGAPYPYFTSPATFPADAWWEVGQIAYANSGASAGYIGAVCTVKGTTWKTFGLIS